MSMFKLTYPYRVVKFQEGKWVLVSQHFKVKQAEKSIKEYREWHPGIEVKIQGKVGERGQYVDVEGMILN